MTSPHLAGDVASVGTAAGIVTLVEGRTFCLSSAAGDITPSLAQGLFIVDTRAIARWELRLNGAPVPSVYGPTADEPGF